jgi:hypothetical protein
MNIAYSGVNQEGARMRLLVSLATLRELPTLEGESQ